MIRRPNGGKQQSYQQQRVGPQVRTTVVRPDGYESMGQRIWVAGTGTVGLLIALFLIALGLAIAALFLPIGGTGGVEPGSNATLNNVNVTGKLDAREGDFTNVWVDEIQGTEGTLDKVTITDATIEKITATEATIDKVTTKEITTETIVAEDGTFDTIMVETGMVNQLSTEAVCPKVLEHIVGGEIPSTHEFQTLRAAVPVAPAPPIPMPMQGAPIGDLSQGSTQALAGGLEVTCVTGPCAFEDDGGMTVLNLGIAEPAYAPGGGVNDPGVSPPTDDESVVVLFTLNGGSLPAGAVGFTIDLTSFVSTEPNYDFVTVRFNGGELNSYSGNGPNAGDPFVVFTDSSITMVPGDELEITYLKDYSWYGGFDYARVKPVNLVFTPESAQGETFLPMTFPSDLTPYIGKQIRICNIAGDNNTLDISPATFDAKGSYSVISFDGEVPCCLTLHVVSASTVSILNRDTSCSHLCIDISRETCVNVVDVTAVCHEVLDHTTGGMISPTHAFQTLSVGGGEPAPSVPLPMDSAPVGSLPEGNTQQLTGGLDVTCTTGPCAFESVDSMVVLNGGEAEPEFRGGYVADDSAVPPDNDEMVVIRFQLNAGNLPPDAAGATVDFQSFVSTETGYDDVTITKNGVEINVYSGFGPNENDPYLMFTDSISMEVGDVVEFKFLKDYGYYLGLDHFYVKPVNMVYQAGALQMTVPADLTPYIGKDYQVCNLDGAAHVLQRESGTWDIDGYWPTIQFEPETMGCCVVFKVIAADKLTLISRGDSCTVFCSGPHCVDPERPEETNFFHGWWRQYNKAIVGGFGFDFSLPYAFIDMTNPTIVVTVLAGTSVTPMEMTQELELFEAEKRLFVAHPDEKSLVTSILPDYTFSFDEAITKQDPNTIAIYDAHSWFPIEPALYKRVESKDNIPPIIRKLTGSASTSPSSANNPADILKLYANKVLFEGHSVLAKDFNDERYIGPEAALGLLETLLTTTITETQPISSIRVTQYPEEGLMEIRTDANHWVMPGKPITITGCTGEWAAFNGEHQSEPGMTSILAKIDPDFIDYAPLDANRSFHHRIGVYFNSTGFPSDANGVAINTGPCVVSAFYGPIQSDTGFDDTFGALSYWLLKAVGSRFHNTLGFRIDETKAVPGTGGPTGYGTVAPFPRTWDDFVDNGIEASTHITRHSNIASTLYRGMKRFTSWRKVGFFDSWPTGFTRVGDLNSRFGVRMHKNLFDVNDKYWFNIARSNYLTDVKVPYWGCDGNTKTNGVNLFFGFAYDSPVGGCDSFDTILLDMGDFPPPDGYHSMTASRLGLNGGPFFPPYASLPDWEKDLLQNYMYVGLINTTLLPDPNLKIGYVQFLDNTVGDYYFYVHTLFMFPPEVTNTDRGYREGYAKMLAPIMRYLTEDLEVDHIIIDIRSSDGGSGEHVVTWRDMFGGGDRQLTCLPETKLAKTDHGRTESVDLSGVDLLDTVDSLTLPEEYCSTFTDINEEFYGNGSVFSGGKVIIMADSRGSSASDIFPGHFLGEAQDRQLGASTETIILGELSGTLSGCSTGIFSSQGPTSEISPLLEQGGISRSPINYQVERGCLQRYPDGTVWSNRPDALKPDCAPSLTGLAGGCPLPNDLEHLLYPDLGFKTNTRSRLPGDTRPQQPDPNDRSTWRDAWLEQAIERAIIEGPQAKKKKMQPFVKPKRSAPKLSSKQQAMSCNSKKRNVIMSLAEMVGSGNSENAVHINISQRDHQKQLRGVPSKGFKQAVGIIDAELKSGGMCLDAQTGKIMVTSTCKQFPMVHINPMFKQ